VVTQSVTDPPGCTPCTSNSQCTGGKSCQTGYCE
jgi:Cys-rich repeat protein